MAIKKLAIFDIDRTLVEGSIGVLFTDYLAGRGLFPLKNQRKIEQAIYLNKQGKLTYRQRGRIIIENWAHGFKGWQRDDILELARKFLYDNLSRIVHNDARQLIRYLHQSRYLVVGISRAYEEILEPLGKYLHLDEVIGTKLEYSDRNFCTGKVKNKMWSDKAKEEAIMDIFKKHNLTTRNSIAFGDTEDDSYMMHFVEYPITVYSNMNLESLPLKYNWPVYNNLRDVLVDLRSGKLMPKFDWFEHYERKYNRIIMDERMLLKSVANEREFIQTVSKYIKKGAKILEVGCGLGRTAITLSLQGYQITAIDDNKRILKIAQINSYNFGKSIKLDLADAFSIDKKFRSSNFTAVVHEGFLEHFANNQIKILLDKQLKVAPLVIFSVPVKSRRNNKYFKNDKIGHRNLWSKKAWRDFL